jgi:predicted HicB family RNase H-like nuclease
LGALALTGAATLRKAVAAFQRSGCDRHFEEAEELEAAKYSGKLSLRMSRSLHRDLSEMAKREGVSLNQLATTILARAVGE